MQKNNRLTEKVSALIRRNVTGKQIEAIANKHGMPKNTFNDVVFGKRYVSDKHYNALVELVELAIENKTNDLTELKSYKDEQL